MEEAHIATTLPNSDNNFFSFLCSTSADSTLDAAHIGFVHFDCTVKHWPICSGHGSTDAVTQVPRGFVASPDNPLNLICRHSLAGLAQQVRSYEPLFEREMRVIENRASGDAKLVLAIAAEVEFLCRRKTHNIGHVAAHTFDLSGPAEPLEQFPALCIGIEHLVNV